MSDSSDSGQWNRVSPRALAEFEAICPAVEEEVLRLCMASDDPQAIMGKDAEGMVRRGLGFVSGMLRSAFAFDADGVVDDELEWGRIRLPVYGVSPRMVLANLERYSSALEERLPKATFAELRPHLERMVSRQRRIARRGRLNRDP